MTRLNFNARLERMTRIAVDISAAIDEFAIARRHQRRMQMVEFKMMITNLFLLCLNVELVHHR